MKKVLITISPLCAILFVFTLISFGLKGTLAFLGAVLFAVALAFGFASWMKFVDKHIKTHLINKDDLVAEIKHHLQFTPEHTNAFIEGEEHAYRTILSFLDTLELKESDLDGVKIGETQIYIEDDGGEPPYNGKQWLDLGCLEYKIPKGKFKGGDNVEVILRKIQKGD